METFFLITSFEDGWREEEFIYDEVVCDYCIEALEVPEEKIEDATYSGEGIELSLCSLTNDDIVDDWYVNLYKVSSKV